jgi:hypothetical protein
MLFAALLGSARGTFRTSQPDSGVSAVGGRAEVVIVSTDFLAFPWDAPKIYCS